MFDEEKYYKIGSIYLWIIDVLTLSGIGTFSSEKYVSRCTLKEVVSFGEAWFSVSFAARFGAKTLPAADTSSTLSVSYALFAAILKEKREKKYQELENN